MTEPPSAELLAAPALGRDFFAREVTEVAKALIGATLMFDGVGGPIVEVEAYDRDDPASHSFKGPTRRNASMFGAPGRAYVYRIYGAHWCLNFVSGTEPCGGAVLIRALEPRFGLERMVERRGAVSDRLLCSGPGRLCQALGITGAHDGLALDQPPFELRAAPAPRLMSTGVRIGITKGAETPWRFGETGSRYLSRPFR